MGKLLEESGTYECRIALSWSADINLDGHIGWDSARHLSAHITGQELRSPNN